MTACLLASALAVVGMGPAPAAVRGREPYGDASPASASPGTTGEAARQQLRLMERDRAAQAATARQQATRAEALRVQQARLAQARVAAAVRLRQADAATAAASDAAAALAVRRQAAEARLQARAADLRPMLPLIERLSLYPAETLLAAPAPPEQALTGLLVLRGLAAQLQSEAQALRAEQAEVAALSLQEQAQAQRVAAARAEQAQQGAALDRQLAAARDAEQDAQDAATVSARAAAQDAARADSLRGLMAAIEAQRRAAEAQAQLQARELARRDAEAARQAAQASAQASRQSAEARRQARAGEAARAAAEPDVPPAGARTGPMVTPVSGTALRGWGAATDAGPASGVTLQAGPGARVVSPCAGRVVFAQPFRSYGRLAIVDCGGGWHVVLGGLDRLDVGAGRAVAAGEPIGAMPDWTPQTPAAGRPSLYVELRRGGRAVDPGPYLGPFAGGRS